MDYVRGTEQGILSIREPEQYREIYDTLETREL